MFERSFDDVLFDGVLSVNVPFDDASLDVSESIGTEISVLAVFTSEQETESNIDTIIMKMIACFILITPPILQHYIIFLSHLQYANFTIEQKIG